jgi:hypothetical protein
MNTLTIAAAAFVLWVGTSPNGSEWDWDPNHTFTSLSDCMAQKQHEIDEWRATARLEENISKDRTRVVDDTVYTYNVLSKTREPIVYRYRCLPDTVNPGEPQERKK